MSPKVQRLRGDTHEERGVKRGEDGFGLKYGKIQKGEVGGQRGWRLKSKKEEEKRNTELEGCVSWDSITSSIPSRQDQSPISTLKQAHSPALCIHTGNDGADSFRLMKVLQRHCNTV